MKELKHIEHFSVNINAGDGELFMPVCSCSPESMLMLMVAMILRLSSILQGDVG